WPARRRYPGAGALAGLASGAAVRGRRARGGGMRADDAAPVRGGTRDRRHPPGRAVWRGLPRRPGGGRALPADLRRASLGGASLVAVGAADPRGREVLRPLGARGVGG